MEVGEAVDGSNVVDVSLEEPVQADTTRTSATINIGIRITGGSVTGGWPCAASKLATPSSGRTGMTFNELLAFIHIVAAITWVGGSIMLQIFGIKAAISKDAEESKHFVGQAMFLGNRVFMPAALVVLGVGIWMVIRIDRFDFDQFWISFGFTMVIVSALLGMLFYNRQVRKIDALVAEGKTPRDPAYSSVLMRIGQVSMVETLALIAVVWAMVVKPGA